MGWWDRVFRILRGPSVTAIERIWLSEEAMLNGLIEQIQELQASAQQVLVVGHFSEDLGAVIETLQAREISFQAWHPPHEIETAIREVHAARQVVLLAKAETLPPINEVYEEPYYPERSPVKISLLAVHHHPDVRDDERILNFAVSLPIDEVTFLSSLDHPLFQRFAGRNLQHLLRTLGMKEEEAIESSMVNRQVSRAQKRIIDQVVSPRPADSADEWFERNLPTI